MNRFAFILHPLSKRDVGRQYPIAARLPLRLLGAVLRRIPPQKVSEITGVRSATGAETEGWFVACPLMPYQLKNEDPRRNTEKIMKAVRVAEGLGADIVGLGALTAVVGDAGITIAENTDIGVTTGNSYTVATALQASIEAAELLDLRPADCTAAIIGATGSIGRVGAKMLAPDVGRIVLNARSPKPLQELAEELTAQGHDAIAETDTDTALRDADIVIAVTSAIEAIVKPQMLKPGAVVCDVARPRDVSEQVARQRDDVLVIEGGTVAVPGDVNFNFDFGFPPGEAYACMAETMMLALEGRCEDYSIGRQIDRERVEGMAALAEKHGFTLAGFRSFEQKLSGEKVEAVRAAISRPDVQ